MMAISPSEEQHMRAKMMHTAVMYNPGYNNMHVRQNGDFLQTVHEASLGL